MPDPVVRNSPALYSVPLHFMQEYVCFATVDLLSVYRPVRGLCRHTPVNSSATRTHARATTALGLTPPSITLSLGAVLVVGG